MSRITACMAQLKSDNRSALIPYITAGDPQPSVTVPLMHAMVEAGADIIELGVPFSDPMADGPVIQRASERALEHKVSLHQVLDMVREFRSRNANTPVVLMGYLNPILRYGFSITIFYCQFSKCFLAGFPECCWVNQVTTCSTMSNNTGIFHLLGH